MVTDAQTMINQIQLESFANAADPRDGDAPRPPRGVG
jgi:hypothetical protein